MKNEVKVSSIAIVLGVVVLLVLTAVLTINLLPNYESGSYYVKIGDEMSAKIEALDINNSKLNIITSGDAAYFCAKSTKSTPESNNLCWKKIENNQASISIFKDRKYYIWIRDVNGNVSSPMSINTNN